jgi:hypothetical protein
VSGGEDPLTLDGAVPVHGDERRGIARHGIEATPRTGDGTVERVAEDPEGAVFIDRNRQGNVRAEVAFLVRCEQPVQFRIRLGIAAQVGWRFG